MFVIETAWTMNPTQTHQKTLLLMMKVMALYSHVLYFVVFTDQCSAYSFMFKIVIVCYGSRTTMVFTMLNYPPVYSLFKRKGAATHLLETMFALARLKIVLSIKNLYHIQCQCVDQ